MIAPLRTLQESNPIVSIIRITITHSASLHVGNRCAIGVGPNGTTHVIRDEGWRQIFSANLLVPQLGLTGNAMISNFPAEGDIVYGVTSGMQAGNHLLMERWASDTQYGAALFTILENSRFHMNDMAKAKQLIDEMIELDSDADPTTVHRLLLLLEDLSFGDFSLGAFIEHYIMGHPAELVNERDLSRIAPL